MNNHEPSFTTEVSNPPASEQPASGQPAVEDAELLGAVDIVEAFTALRHELKLQVRSGRELQQMLGESLQRIESSLATRFTANGTASTSGEGRKLAEALAEIDEALQRAVETFSLKLLAPSSHSSLLKRFDQAMQRASWITKKLNGKLFDEIRSLVTQSAGHAEQQDDIVHASCQGLELLLARLQRLMQHCEIERVDVIRRPFDAETMRAIDFVDAPDIPSAHVAEQIRPAYVWQGKVLSYADVRLAK